MIVAKFERETVLGAQVASLRREWRAFPAGDGALESGLHPAFIRPSSEINPASIRPSAIIRPPSGLHPPQSDLIRPNPTNTKGFFVRHENQRPSDLISVTHGKGGNAFGETPKAAGEDARAPQSN
jgi:hypothetical protein